MLKDNSVIYTGDKEALSTVLFYHGLDALKGLINSGRGF